MEKSSFDTITYIVDEGIATITLNRPAQKNALNLAMRAELANVIYSARRDKSIHALILTGAGGAFCAGGDIRAMQEGLSAEAGRERMLDLHLWLEELLRFDRPVIAAVDGPAYGAGFGLALTADFVLATPAARFCLSFLRLGLIPDCGVFYTLPRIVGLQRAKELALSAREITAQEAKELGIVFEVQPQERLAERAQQMALSFTHASVSALSLTKRAFNSSLNSNLETMLDIEADGQAIARTTEYHLAAVARFMEKKPPRFQWPAE